MYNNNKIYPAHPGFKKFGPSQTAANEMCKIAPTVREKRLELFAVVAHLTADEAAEKLNLNILTVRPRISEMSRQGLICQTGARRQNTSGKSLEFDI